MTHEPNLSLADGPRPRAAITVCMQPGGDPFTLPRPKTVLQLLKKLGIRRGAALVIRDGGLLTEDQHIYPGEHITVRIVTSSG